MFVRTCLCEHRQCIEQPVHMYTQNVVQYDFGQLIIICFCVEIQTVITVVLVQCHSCCIQWPVRYMTVFRHQTVTMHQAECSVHLPYLHGAHITRLPTTISFHILFETLHPRFDYSLVVLIGVSCVVIMSVVNHPAWVLSGMTGRHCGAGWHSWHPWHPWLATGCLNLYDI